jgi:hypothetical protein
MNKKEKVWKCLALDFVSVMIDAYFPTVSSSTSITTALQSEAINNLKKFRPISHLNCSFKIFTEVLTNRLASLMHILTSSNQTSFIKDSYILESVVTAHEVLLSVRMLKLNYENGF